MLIGKIGLLMTMVWSWVNPVWGIIDHGSRELKQVALTFDACMTPHMQDELKTKKVASWYNENVLKILDKDQIPATFFVSGLWAESYPLVVKGWSKNTQYEIENHSWDHAAMKTPCYGLADAVAKVSEVTKTAQVLEDLIGHKPKYFRFPGGCYDQSDLKLVQDKEERGLGWDVVSGDSFLRDPAKIEHEVLSKVDNGSIIVMHVVGGRTAPNTAEALPGIIKGLKDQGYQLVKVEDLLTLKKQRTEQ